MSGSGGYYRYHCKNWLSYDCQNWVWMNNTPCANCVANGRDSESVSASWTEVTWEAKTPFIKRGAIRYLSSEEFAAMPAPFTIATDAVSETKPRRQMTDVGFEATRGD